MPSESATWLRWVLGMGERRKLGDVAMDILLFAGMVSRCSSTCPGRIIALMLIPLTR